MVPLSFSGTTAGQKMGHKLEVNHGLNVDLPPTSVAAPAKTVRGLFADKSDKSVESNKISAPRLLSAFGI